VLFLLPCFSVGQNLSKKDLLCKKWVLAESISGNCTDPKIIMTDYTSDIKPHELWEFNLDNTYMISTPMNSTLLEDNRMNIEKGYWAFNKDSTKLGKQTYYFNSKEIEGSMSFRWSIISLSETMLKIHFSGPVSVQMTYISAKLSN